MTNKIKIYWWNFGLKTLEFNGELDEYLKQKDIFIEKTNYIIDNKTNIVTIKDSYNIKFNIGGAFFEIRDNYSDYEKVAIDTIKLFLMRLGDKALIEYGNQRIYINK